MSSAQSPRRGATPSSGSKLSNVLPTMLLDQQDDNASGQYECVSLTFDSGLPSNALWSWFDGKGLTGSSQVVEKQVVMLVGYLIWIWCGSVWNNSIGIDISRNKNRTIIYVQRFTCGIIYTKKHTPSTCCSGTVRLTRLQSIVWFHGNPFPHGLNWKSSTLPK